MDYNQSNEDTHRAFELWVYRRMLKISWIEKITNKGILSRMKRRQNLFTIIQTGKLKYFGHINRHSSMHTTLLIGRVHGKWRRRRRRTSWPSNIKEWTGKSYIEAARLTSNTYIWLEDRCTQPSTRGSKLMMTVRFTLHIAPTLTSKMASSQSGFM